MVCICVSTVPLPKEEHLQGFTGIHLQTKDSHFSLQWQSSKRPQASLVDEASLENKDEEQFVYKMNISLSDLCSYT